MDTINAYFDKVIYINSKRRLDRYININKRLDALGIKAQRFEALYGGAIPDSQKNFGDVKKPLNHAEVGCFQSHVAIYKMIKENGWQRTLILEDDAMFWKDGLKNHPLESYSDFLDTFKHISSIIPKSWDMLYFGQNNYDKTSGEREVTDKMAALKEKIGEVGVYSIFSADRCWLTHAYAVDIRCIDYLIENTKVMYSCIDHVLANCQNKLEVYAFHPSIILQDATKSSLR